jgi:transposase
MDLFGIKRRARSESLKGRVVTEETRRKLSKANKGKHHSPPTEFKEGHPPYFKPTKEMWQKAAEAHRKFYLSKDELAGLYEKRGLSAPQIAEMIGVTTTTVVDWLKRFQIPIRSNAESTRLLWERFEYVKKQKSWARPKLSEEAKKRLSESLKRIYSHPLLRQKMREQTKNLWKKLDYREKVLKNTLKAVHKRPTHAEEILLRIIKKHHFPFKYVGDGQVIIGCLNPDFIHCDGQKKVIEVFGRVYHDPEVSFLHLDWKRQPFGRIAYYAQFGYDCLILWDDELEDEEKVVERVKSWA